MFFMACRNEVDSVVEHATDPETTPTMTTDSVRTLQFSFLPLSHTCTETLTGIACSFSSNAL